MKRISKEDFRKCMQEIKDTHVGDPEKMHCEADDLMCDVLKSLGYDKGIEIFETMETWYA